jgi:hypothetical protein
MLEFHISNVLKVFQQCVLELDTLTEDQKMKMKKIKELVRVLIDGRAGSGKTFVAMHCILELMRSNANVSSQEERGLMLVCFDCLTLGNDLVKWIHARLGGSIEETNRQLDDIHFMYRDGNDSVLRHLQIRESGNEDVTVGATPMLTNHKVKYELIVVDEGHHVFTKRKLSKRLPLFNEVKEIVKVSREKVKDIGEYGHVWFAYCCPSAPSFISDHPLISFFILLLQRSNSVGT